MDDNQEKYHDQIDGYLRDELSDKEKTLFEQSLQEDPDLLAEFTIHEELFAQMDESSWGVNINSLDKDEVKEVASYFRSEEVIKLKDTIEKVKANYHRDNETFLVKNKWIIPILIAASISLFIILYSINFSESPQELYAKYSTWQDLPSLTSRSDEDLLAKGQELFEEKNYKESFLLFNHYLKNSDTIIPSVYLYAGVSSLELDKYEEAIFYFDQLINSNAVDQSKGYWYKALSFLKQGKKEAAIKTLNNILENKDNYNFKEAKNVLKKLQ
ncbi:hypothetical protein GCM10009430_44140 [Aquimarina litoralis]|uniref:Tetratricopeptide repeat protein n=1 Tax=Aquimarina litoralis TaxID=584605 RepID=A0ABP3UH21_9FLAO